MNVKRFLKWARLVTCLLPRLILDYFRIILPYSRHPERYPLSLRYARLRALILKVAKHLRIDFKVKGYGEFLSRPSGCLIYGNHVAVCDVIALIALSEEPISFVGKKEVRKIPLVGRVFKAIDGLFLDREDPRQAIAVFKEAERRMKGTGLSYVIFPEGTRAKGEAFATLLPFHPGSFKIAFRIKAPLLPFAISGTERLLSGDLDRRHLVLLSFFKAVLPSDYEGLSTVAYAEKAQKAIAAERARLLELDAEYYQANRQKEKLPKGESLCLERLDG